MTGVAPAPTALKLIRGTQASRINMNEPIPAVNFDDLEPHEAAARFKPDMLNNDEIASKIWDDLAWDLIRAGVLKPWDIRTFAEYCLLSASVERAAIDVSKHGAYVLTVERELRDGTVVFAQKKNPAWLTFRDGTGRILQYTAKFGLTPSDRSKISVGENRGGDNSASRYL